MITNCRITNKTKVQAGLAMSPADIERMTAQGRAASLGSLEGSQFYDNLPAGADVPIEDRRGVDLNILWRESKASQKKINEARSKAIAAERAKVTDPKLN